MKEYTKFLILAGVFLLLYFAPIEAPVVVTAVSAGLALLQDYARLHVLTCLVPAFFIAGTIAVYVKKDAVLRLLGPATKKYIAYPVSTVSGGILAVCSCTILPLFTGIYKRGAGIGPAAAFLFAGPAVNITAILLTSSVLGWEFAAARLVAAAVISIAAGLILAFVFRDHDRKNANGEFAAGVGNDLPYSNLTVTTFLLLQLVVLVVFGLALDPTVKGALIVGSLLGIGGLIVGKFEREHSADWLRETWDLSKKILPFLFLGVFFAGMIEAVVPREIITRLVGDNTMAANAVASTFGAFMYFATLTEVPIVQQLMNLGMNKGPALTLFLTGNALSLPSMIVLFKVMGKKQASVYIVTVMGLSIVAGFLFGQFT
ncbi:MAG: permease [Bacteroidota bacterium]